MTGSAKQDAGAGAVRVLRGRYRLDARIGVGGMGEVWRAHDTELGRDVAVKLLTLPRGSSESERAELLARFRQEARAAASLDGPNIVALHDHGIDGGGDEDGDGEGTPFLVMALVRGRTLAEVLGQEVRAAVPDALEWCRQIAVALSAAHAAGIIHRDIKPANAMLDAHGTVKVLDFGIATFLAESRADTRLTRTGEMPFGSVAYLAPERFEDSPGDARTDLYALGCVLYELLTARPPFTGSAAAVLRGHVSEQPLRPSRLRREVPERVDRMVLALLRKDPERRPGTATEVAEALRALLDGSAAVLVEALDEEEDEENEAAAEVRDALPASFQDARPEVDLVSAPEAPRAVRPSGRLVAMLAAGVLVLTGAGVVGVNALSSDGSSGSAESAEGGGGKLDHWTIAVDSNLQELDQLRVAVDRANRSKDYPVRLRAAQTHAPTSSRVRDPSIVAIITGGSMGPGAANAMDREQVATVATCGVPRDSGSSLPNFPSSTGFQLAAGPDVEGSELSRYLTEVRKVKTVQLVGEPSQTIYTRGKRLIAELQDAKVEVKTVSPQDPATTAAKIAAEAPDAVVVEATGAEQITWPERLRAAGYRGLGVVYPDAYDCGTSAPRPWKAPEGWLTTRVTPRPDPEVDINPQLDLTFKVVLKAVREAARADGAKTSRGTRAAVINALRVMHVRQEDGHRMDIKYSDDRPVWVEQSTGSRWSELGTIETLTKQAREEEKERKRKR
jgi:hypothetical protein